MRPVTVAAEPFLPESDAYVMERVRSGDAAAAEKEIRSLDAARLSAPDDVGHALRLARRLLAAGRSEADPRRVARVPGIVAAWCTGPASEPEALVLRAAARQGLHDFPGALSDLDAALKLAPTHAGAWLARTTIQCVLADFAGARRSAARLATAGDPFVAVVAAAQVAALTGDSAAAVKRLEEVLARDAEQDREVRAWALIVLAETAARRGDWIRAEGAFHRALASMPGDPYALGAYADFLIDRRLPGEVAALIGSRAGIDALRLRLAEALPGAHREDVALLRTRFGIARSRGDVLHRREEARFRLRLIGDARGALELARDNWDVQREPADARILLEAARAAGDSSEAERLLAELRAQGLEDVALGLPVRSESAP